MPKYNIEIIRTITSATNIEIDAIDVEHAIDAAFLEAQSDAKKPADLQTLTWDEVENSFDHGDCYEAVDTDDEEDV